MTHNKYLRALIICWGQELFSQYLRASVAIHGPVLV